MEKENKSKCSFAVWCLYGCLFANVLLLCLLLYKELNQYWPCLKVYVCAILFIANLFGVIMLTIHINVMVKSEESELNTKLQEITDEYKKFVNKELRRISNESFIANNNIYKTIEIIAETYSDRNCNDFKLETLKEVIDAIIKSHEADRQIKSNSEQSQEEIV